MATFMTPARLRLTAATSGLMLAVCGVVGSTAAGAATASADGTTPYVQVPLASWRVDGTGYASLIVGNTLYVGGSFTQASDQSGFQAVSKSNLAAFNLTTGALIQTFTADTDGSVRALASDGTRLFLGGRFTTVNGVGRGRIAAVDLATGALLPWQTYATGAVNALATSGDTLYVGGEFTKLVNTTRSRLGAFSLADGSLKSWAPAASGVVNSLSVTSDGGRIYIGGYFGDVNGNRLYGRGVAAVTSAGALVPIAWSHTDATIMAIDLTDDGKYLAISNTHNRAGLWDIATGRDKWSFYCDGDGQAVMAKGDFMYSGFHDGCAGTQAKILSNSISLGGDRDDTFVPSTQPFMGIRSFAATSGYLVATGDITSAGGLPAGGFAIYPAKSTKR